MFGSLFSSTRTHELDIGSRSPISRTSKIQNLNAKSLIVTRPEREKGKRVRINITGKKFETYMTTLTSKDGSIFKLNGISKMFDGFRNEYYFERDSKSFERILVYMQCGVCEKPEQVPYQRFIEELQYFGFHEVALKIYRKNCINLQNKPCDVRNIQTIRSYIWHALEYPRMDKISRLLTLFSSTIILISTISLCISSVPSVKQSQSIVTIHKIELYCLVWFTMETCTRFVTCNQKKAFIKNPMNIIDVLSLLPVYILKASQNGKHVFLATALRILRVTRLIPAYGSDTFIRIFNTIILTLLSSVKEFTCFFSLLVFMFMLFACLLYSIENGASYYNEDFASVPKSIWYCVVTITSVGYGDVVPTSLGKLI